MTRTTYYQGVELRKVDTTQGWVHDDRRCHLYPRGALPSNFMPAFAAIDLDNT